MDYILDANSIIYLVKAQLFDQFMDLTERKVEIDTSVHKEVVEDGIKLGYADAKLIDQFLKKYQIPIIPVDITKVLPIFRDPGESSCFILSKTGKICISSDKRALNKMKKRNIKVMQLDTFFFIQAKKKKIQFEDFRQILWQLRAIFATKTVRINSFIKNLQRDDTNE